jgi:hypothetical protein
MVIFSTSSVSFAELAEIQFHSFVSTTTSKKTIMNGPMKLHDMAPKLTSSMPSHLAPA